MEREWKRFAGPEMCNLKWVTCFLLFPVVQKEKQTNSMQSWKEQKNKTMGSRKGKTLQFVISTMKNRKTYENKE